MVYLLWHEDDPEVDESTLVGVYGSEAEAASAIARFAEHPQGFSVDAHSLNGNRWLAAIPGAFLGNAAND
ncbi:hypothetical protein [Novosphingobium sp. PhB165]|uniref:hypothetical protein n=1 Tax=Novosphingobium sp. PhB165 TaxID=2485105 RepID=UPI0014052D1E|nr:hypothetical protein [Novosphingobium sp. PhB165]